MAENPELPLRGECLASGHRCEGTVVSPGSETRTPYIMTVGDLNELNFDEARCAEAILCRKGCRNSHVAVFCRILGIPILSLGRHFEHVRLGMTVYLEPNSGSVWFDAPPPNSLDHNRPAASRFLGSDKNLNIQLSIIDSLNIRAANAKNDGRVRQLFLREEFVWARHNRHPFQTLVDDGADATAHFLAKHLQDCCSEIQPTQFLNFRSLDLRSNEFTKLQPEVRAEANPHLGVHGIRRLLQNGTLLKAELSALALLTPECRARIIYSLPFVTYAAEVETIAEALSSCAVPDQPLGVFIETPSAVEEIKQILQLGVRHIYVGTKDLTQFLLACDRDNPSVAHLYTPRAPVVMNTLRKLCAICAQSQISPFVFCAVEDIDYYLQEVPEIRSISLTYGEFINHVGS